MWWKDTCKTFGKTTTRLLDWLFHFRKTHKCTSQCECNQLLFLVVSRHISQDLLKDPISVRFKQMKSPLWPRSSSAAFIILSPKPLLLFHHFSMVTVDTWIFTLTQRNKRTYCTDDTRVLSQCGFISWKDNLLIVTKVTVKYNFKLFCFSIFVTSFQHRFL